MKKQAFFVLLAFLIMGAQAAMAEEQTFPANYKFYQDYNVVTRTNADSDTKAFVDFATSPEGQEIVAAMKHIRVKM